MSRCAPNLSPATLVPWQGMEREGPKTLLRADSRGDMGQASGAPPARRPSVRCAGSPFPFGIPLARPPNHSGRDGWGVQRCSGVVLPS